MKSSGRSYDKSTTNRKKTSCGLTQRRDSSWLPPSLCRAVFARGGDALQGAYLSLGPQLTGDEPPGNLPQAGPQCKEMSASSNKHVSHKPTVASCPTCRLTWPSTLPESQAPNSEKKHSVAHQYQTIRKQPSSFKTGALQQNARLGRLSGVQEGLLVHNQVLHRRQARKILNSICQGRALPQAAHNGKPFPQFIKVFDLETESDKFAVIVSSQGEMAGSKCGTTSALVIQSQRLSNFSDYQSDKQQWLISPSPSADHAHHALGTGTEKQQTSDDSRETGLLSGVMELVVRIPNFLF